MSRWRTDSIPSSTQPIAGPSAAPNTRMYAVSPANNATLADLYRRPELDWRAVEQVAVAGGVAGCADAAALERIAIEIVYAGYLRRQEVEAAKLQRVDAVRVPDEMDYRGIPGLSNEVVEKLEAIRPRSVGQASRISGMTPAAISILLTHITLVERRRTSTPS